MRLVSVDPTKSKRGGINYIITFDDGVSSELLGDTVLHFHLHAGDEFTSEQWSEICLYDEEQQIVAKIIDWISRRARSEGELRTRLLTSGYQKCAVDRALSRLKDHGYLDDRQFAVKFVRALIKKKPVGEHRLRAELTKKGITGNDLETALEEVRDKQEELARQAAIKKMKILRKTDPLKRKTQLWRFLEQRGFSADIIHKVLNEMFS